MQIQERLSKFPVPEMVWDEYHLDQEINDRGIRVDMPLVKQAISLDEMTRERLTLDMQALTDLENPNSVTQMKAWLSENGVEMDTLGKKAVAAMIGETDGDVADALSLRLQLAKSSVKKYQAMENAACMDGRCRGMFMFYGANRTGRFAGRLVQIQNLPQNHMEDLAEARALVRAGNTDALDMLYDDIPDTLSQLIRTAFIPADGLKFYVADFSAIEARVIAWFAGETWRNELFDRGGDIYCQSASEMFGVPVVKNGINGHLRQKGKVAELACIAEGSTVLTDRGLVPIESITTDMKLWDGEDWVTHEGVVYKGTREVITYDGLTATADHLVWVEGKPEPVQFGTAAACGLHLVKTGDGRRALRMGGNNITAEKVEQSQKSLLCSDRMRGVRSGSVADAGQSEEREIARMPTVFTAEADTEVAGQKAYGCKAEMREYEGQRLRKLRGKRHPVFLRERDGGRTLSHKGIRTAGTGNGDRPHRYKWRLCSRESAVCNAQGELYESEKKCPLRIFTGILAVLLSRGYKKTVAGTDQGRDNSGCGDGGVQEKKELETDIRTARLYDIRNAGQHHRFTVSDCLVHNCGYGGSVGALKAMGALDMGLSEEELQPLVDMWRQSNPNIVKFWWAVDTAVKKAIREKSVQKVGGVRFECRSGMLFVTLPSGRTLSYVKPKMGINKFGGESVTYEGVGGTKKWERIESYGPKFVENIVQATSRDILMYAMKTLRCCSIVAHVHDELIIEADPKVSLDAICEQMGRVPPWAEGLILRADGYTCDFYMKD